MIPILNTTQLLVRDYIAFLHTTRYNRAGAAKLTKTEQWIDKAEEFIDNTADKIHKSETSRKADKSFEKTTLSIFRKAGKLWGKPERYFKPRVKKRIQNNICPASAGANLQFVPQPKVEKMCSFKALNISIRPISTPVTNRREGGCSNCLLTILSITRMIILRM